MKVLKKFGLPIVLAAIGYIVASELMPMYATAKAKLTGGSNA